MEGGTANALRDTHFVETLRRFLCELSVEVEEMVRVLEQRARKWPQLEPEVLEEELIAVAVDGRPALSPARRRTARRYMPEVCRSLEISSSADSSPFSLVAEERENAAHPWAGASREELSRLKGHLVVLRDSARRQPYVEELSQRLSAAKTMEEMLRVAQGQYSGLAPSKVGFLLIALGAPVAIPRRPTIIFLERCGLLTASPKPSQTRQHYRALVQRLSHNANASVGAIELLLHVFSGAWRLDSLRPICVQRWPSCKNCSLDSLCLWEKKGQRPTPRPVPPVRNWPHHDRPREKLWEGKELTNSELLAIILRTGDKERTVLDLARAIVEAVDNNLAKLLAMTPQQLAQRLRAKKLQGIGRAKIAQICAALELGRRATSPDIDPPAQGPAMTQSKVVFEHFRSQYYGASQEEFRMLLLDTKHRIIGNELVSRGTLDASIVHPRDVFRRALDFAAAAVIFIHNHPSGDPTPSREDRALTRRLCEAGKLLGIRVLDHIIIGAQEYFSFADEGELTT